MMRLIPLILLLAACERTEHKPGPGGVTMSEAKAVDDAAVMLNARGEGTVDPATATTTKATP